MNEDRQRDSSDGQSIRCFIAVELPDETKQWLGQLQQRLRDRVASNLEETARCEVKWVTAETIHITLQFLGSTHVGILAEMEKGLRGTVAKATPFQITIGGLGMFPSANRPRVIWVGISDKRSRLRELQGRVEQATGKFGFKAEQRAFSPHLTLARVREGMEPEVRRTFGSVVKSLVVPERRPITVQEISIMRSELSPKGARYTRIAAVPF